MLGQRYLRLKRKKLCSLVCSLRHFGPTTFRPITEKNVKVIMHSCVENIARRLIPYEVKQKQFFRWDTSESQHLTSSSYFLNMTTTGSTLNAPTSFFSIFTSRINRATRLILAAVSQKKTFRKRFFSAKLSQSRGVWMTVCVIFRVWRKKKTIPWGKKKFWWEHFKIVNIRRENPPPYTTEDCNNNKNQGNFYKLELGTFMPPPQLR